MNETHEFVRGARRGIHLREVHGGVRREDVRADDVAALPADEEPAHGRGGEERVEHVLRAVGLGSE